MQDCTSCTSSVGRHPQAVVDLRSAPVQRGTAAQHRVSYHLRSLGRFLDASKTYTAELIPVALLLLVLHSEQR